MDRTITIVDVETTGLEPPPETGVCELAQQTFTWGDDGLSPAPINARPRQIYLNPGKPIPAEVSAIHHITDDMVAGAPPWQPAIQAVIDEKRGATDHFWCAHNARFDAQYSPPGLSWICTYKCALRRWPREVGHSLQVLRYARGIKVNEQRVFLPHTATADVYMAGLVLEALIADGVTPEQMLAWSAKPAILAKVTFGQHSGSYWRDVPDDYLNWILYKSTGEWDEDILYTARLHMQQRMKSA